MKRYIKPNTEVFYVRCSQMMAVSLIEGVDADDSVVYGKEYEGDYSSWIDWENEHSILHR